MNNFYLDDNKSKKQKISLAILIVVVVVVLIGSLLGCFYLGYFVGKDKGNIITDKKVEDYIENTPLLYEIYELLKENYYQDVTWEDVQLLGAAGMVGSLDDFSGLGYAFTINKKSFGISITTNIFNEHFVTRVENNSPAGNAKDANNNKIERGDKIIAVNNIEISGITNANLNADTNLFNQNEITLTLQKTTGTKFSVELSRDFYKTDFSDYIPFNNGVGLISLTSFSEGAEKDFDASINAFLKDTTANKLILDLRDNGGGSTVQLSKIAAYFIENNTGKDIPIIKFNKKSATEYITVSASDSGKHIGNKKTNFELSILINGSSASASEALLGAIRYYNPNVSVVGSETYGKGVGQSVFEVGGGMYYASITTGTFDVPILENGKLVWKNYHKTPMQPDTDLVIPKLSVYAKHAEFAKYYNNTIMNELAVDKAINVLLN